MTQEWYSTWNFSFEGDAFLRFFWETVSFQYEKVEKTGKHLEMLESNHESQPDSRMKPLQVHRC